MKEFNCVDIREVWDFRLSTACPTIYNQPYENWRVVISSNGEDNTLLEEYDTGIPSTPDDNWNKEGLTACYNWLYSVRDKYSRPNIELRKPVVALINGYNTKIQELCDAFVEAESKGDLAEADRLDGAKNRLIKEANKAVTLATNEMHSKIAELEGK